MMLQYFLTLLFIIGMALPCNSQDQRFGTVGNSPDFNWWRGSNADWLSLNHPKEESRLWFLGKLDHRNDNLDWCKNSNWWDGGDKSCFVDSKKKQDNLYLAIFNSEKPHIAEIIESMPDGSDIHIVIGNEPNLLPYVDPFIYAKYFKMYYDEIKRLQTTTFAHKNVNCIIHSGPVILVDIKDGLIDLYQFFQNLLSGNKEEVEYVGWYGWFAAFLHHLHNIRGKVDIFNFHVYDTDEFSYEWFVKPNNPIEDIKSFMNIAKGGIQIGTKEDRNELPSQYLICKKENKVRDLTGHKISDTDCSEGNYWRNVDGMVIKQLVNWSYSNPIFWVDEFGVIGSRVFPEQLGSEQYIKDQMTKFVNFFKKNPAIDKWFWYKTTGECAICKDIPLAWVYKIALYSDDLSVRTGLGDHYFSLMDPSFTIPPGSPRVSWRPFDEREVGGWDKSCPEENELSFIFITNFNSISNSSIEKAWNLEMESYEYTNELFLYSGTGGNPCPNGFASCYSTKAETDRVVLRSGEKEVPYSGDFSTLQQWPSKIKKYDNGICVSNFDGYEIEFKDIDDIIYSDYLVANPSSKGHWKLWVKKSSSGSIEYYEPGSSTTPPYKTNPNILRLNDYMSVGDEVERLTYWHGRYFGLGVYFPTINKSAWMDNTFYVTSKDPTKSYYGGISGNFYLYEKTEDDIHEYYQFFENRISVILQIVNMVASEFHDNKPTLTIDEVSYEKGIRVIGNEIAWENPTQLGKHTVNFEFENEIGEKTSGSFKFGIIQNIVPNILTPLLLN